MTDYARGEVNDLGGYHAFGPELINGDSVCAFDTTKLSVHTREVLDYVLYAKSKGCFMTGPADMKINRINVVR